MMPYIDPEKRRRRQQEYRKLNQEKAKAYNRSYYQQNREEIIVKQCEYAREYRRRNRKEIIVKQREYRQRNRKEISDQNREYGRKNRKAISDYRRVYDRKRRANDLAYRLRVNLRSRLYSAIRNGQKAGSAVRDLGCSVEEFAVYISSLFEPGMSWDNRSEWHLDHIKPLAVFDLTDRKQFLAACHYTNLQPLWAADNLSKGAR